MGEFIGVPCFALLVVEVFNFLCFVFILKKIVDSYISSGHVVDMQCKPNIILSSLKKKKKKKKKKEYYVHNSFTIFSQ